MLFWSYMYVEKAAETMFERKNSMQNVDEIDTWPISPLDYM